MPRLLLALTLCAVLAAGNACAESWQSVPADSTLRFITRFDGSETPGEFHRFMVRLTLGASGGSKASLDVVIDVTSADMFSGELNEGLVEPAWFHVDRYPRARYSSDEIEQRKQGKYTASGLLELKGVQRPVEVPFQWRREENRGRLQGSLVLHRSHFEIGSGEWAEDDAIGDEVRVEFDVAMVPKD